MNNEKILEKKMNNYTFDTKDIHVEGELMVTITLGEYRQLVTEAAEMRFERHLRLEAERKLNEINSGEKVVSSNVPRVQTAPMS